MRQLGIAVALVLLATGCSSGSDGRDTNDTSTPLSESVRVPAPRAAAAARATLRVPRAVLVRASALPTESCCRWKARRVFHAFRGDTDDPCAIGSSFAPRARHGVVSRVFAYRGRTDRIFLSSARSTVVRLPRPAAARKWAGRYARTAFDCRPRQIDGASPGSATAVYAVVRRAPGRTVIADEVTDLGATIMRRYFDIRRVGSYVAIVVYECGEEIDYSPDLRREDKIADAQQRRLRRLRA